MREILTGVEAVIVDEIHAVAQSKRGAHLALTLERLGTSSPTRATRSRSGSGSRRPSARSSGSPQFLVGPNRECEIVDAGITKELDLEIHVPVEDMTDPGADAAADRLPSLARPLTRVEALWTRAEPALDLAGDLPASSSSLVQEHTSTIIFVNNRRGAERLAKRLNELANEQPEQELPATEHAGNQARRPRPASRYVEIARAHHGSLAHEERLVVEEMLKSGSCPASSRPPRSSSASTWAPSTS